MLAIDIPLLIAALLFGFAGGYVVRDLKSRQKRQRFREKYVYGPPPVRANGALQRSTPTSAGHGAQSTCHSSQKAESQPIPELVLRNRVLACPSNVLAPAVRTSQAQRDVR